MRQLLRNRVFGRLYLAQLVSLGGTGLLTIALGLLAYDLAGANAATVLGTALAIKMVAYVLMAPLMRAALAFVLATRVLVGADLVRVAMAACLPLVHHTWQIYLLVFALQTAAATFTPTFTAAITRVVPDDEQYTTAVSASRAAYDAEALISPLIAGALLTVIAYSELFFCTAMGFILSALLVGTSGLGRIDRHSRVTPTTPKLLQRISSGPRILLSRSEFRGVVAANVTVAAGTAVVLVNTVIYVRSAIGADDTAVAIGLACFGCGSILATIAVPHLTRRFRVTSVALAGAVGITIALLATCLWMSLAPKFALLAGTWVALGAATSLINTIVPRLIRDHTTIDERDDVFAAQFSTSHAAFLVTYALAGWGPTIMGSPRHRGGADLPRGGGRAGISPFLASTGLVGGFVQRAGYLAYDDPHRRFTPQQPGRGDSPVGERWRRRTWLTTPRRSPQIPTPPSQIPAQVCTTASTPIRSGSVPLPRPSPCSPTPPGCTCYGCSRRVRPMWAH